MDRRTGRGRARSMARVVVECAKNEATGWRGARRASFLLGAISAPWDGVECSGSCTSTLWASGIAHLSKIRERSRRRPACRANVANVRTGKYARVVCRNHLAIANARSGAVCPEVLARPDRSSCMMRWCAKRRDRAKPCFSPRPLGRHTFFYLRDGEAD